MAPVSSPGGSGHRLSLLPHSIRLLPSVHITLWTSFWINILFILLLIDNIRLTASFDEWIMIGDGKRRTLSIIYHLSLWSIFIWWYLCHEVAVYKVNIDHKGKRTSEWDRISPRESSSCSCYRRFPSCPTPYLVGFRSTSFLYTLFIVGQEGTQR